MVDWRRHLYMGVCSAYRLTFWHCTIYLKLKPVSLCGDGGGGNDLGIGWVGTSIRRIPGPYREGHFSFCLGDSSFVLGGRSIYVSS